MKEKDLPFDRTKHAVYTKNAERCVKKLLARWYDKPTAEVLWERIQLKYCDFLKDEPPLGGLKMTASVYDPILIFAWYDVVPDKPPLADIQQDVFDCFMSGFDVLGKIFNLNRRADNRLANLAFRNAADLREKEIAEHPASFRMGGYDYDRENGVVRYCFTQCPNAEFAKRHHMEDVLPVMCNCDHMAMERLRAVLIREGTCVTSDRCDYLIAGDRNPVAAEYERRTADNGLWISVKKQK